MKKFGVLLCVMLCVPMFAFKANNEEQIILTVQYERPDKGHGGLHRTSVRHLYLDQNDHILTIPNSEGWVVEIYQDETLLYRETICNDGIVVIPSDIKGEMILKVTNGSIVVSGSAFIPCIIQKKAVTAD